MQHPLLIYDEDTVFSYRRTISLGLLSSMFAHLVDGEAVVIS